jgi:glycosyltransferase involved in cell wall biosynthesis
MAPGLYERGRRARLRVGLGPALADADPRTGHGKVWTRVLKGLVASGKVRLVGRGRADVWLASGHDEPPQGRPLVVQVHEVGWREPALRRFLHPAFASQMETATQAALHAATHVITPSEAARRQVIDAYGWPAECVHAVHHGVDHELLRPGIAGGRELVGAPYVLFVGVAHPRKNFAAVREAVAGLAGSGLPQVLAMVAGPAADRPDPLEFEPEALAELPGLPGRIVALRAVSDADLAALMAGADVLCLPSHFEGFGLPVLEAMACGTPVVVSNRGALPEVVGNAGLIVEPDAAAVEGALRRVLTEPGLAEDLRRRALDRAGEFSWERTCEGWLRVLEAAA